MVAIECWASAGRGRHAARPAGFTIIELLVVMAAVGLLLAVVAPRYVEHVDRAREVVLQQNLKSIRDAIDQFSAHRGRYPADLQELVTDRYLRDLPVDPVLDRTDRWILIGPGGQPGVGAVADVRSGAPGRGRDGRLYAQW